MFIPVSCCVCLVASLVWCTLPSARRGNATWSNATWHPSTKNRMYHRAVCMKMRPKSRVLASQRPRAKQKTRKRKRGSIAAWRAPKSSTIRFRRSGPRGFVGAQRTLSRSLRCCFETTLSIGTTVQAMMMSLSFSVTSLCNSCLSSYQWGISFARWLLCWCSARCKSVNFAEFLTKGVVDIIQRHIKLYRKAVAAWEKELKDKNKSLVWMNRFESKINRVVGFKTFESGHRGSGTPFFQTGSNLQAHLWRYQLWIQYIHSSSVVVHHLEDYFRDVSEVLLYMVLPPCDFDSTILRYLVRVRSRLFCCGFDWI